MVRFFCLIWPELKDGVKPVKQSDCSCFCSCVNIPYVGKRAAIAGVRDDMYRNTSSAAAVKLDCSFAFDLRLSEHSKGWTHWFHPGRRLQLLVLGLNRSTIAQPARQETQPNEGDQTVKKFQGVVSARQSPPLNFKVALFLEGDPRPTPDKTTAPGHTVRESKQGDQVRRNSSAKTSNLASVAMATVAVDVTLLAGWLPGLQSVKPRSQIASSTFYNEREKNVFH